MSFAEKHAAAGYQVFARAAAPRRRTRTRASTATQPSGRASTGFRSSSATAGRSSPSRASRCTRSTSAAASAARRATEAAHEPAGLAAGDELLGVTVRERRDPERRLADQLGEDAARPERDERAEDRVLDDAGEELGAARDHRLDDDRRADALGRLAHGLLVGEVERDAAGLGLVRPGDARS